MKSGPRTILSYLHQEFTIREDNHYFRRLFSVCVLTQGRPERVVSGIGWIIFCCFVATSTLKK